jgi:two-component sensor histidine kinase/putative methionine-R-sulfoxide reductase with GAF domain
MAATKSAGVEGGTGRAIAYQQALAAFTRLVGEAATVERLMHTTVAQVSRVTDIRHVKIMRYRPESGDLLLEAGVGWKPGVVGNATLGGDHRSPPGRSIQTAAPVSIEDLPNDPEWRYSDLLREHGVVSVLNVPIMLDGLTWGVLEVDTQQRTRFDEIDTTALTIFANIFGMALARCLAGDQAIEAAAETSRRDARADVLLRELQHRVKNNFQVIIGFLTLQRRLASTDDARERISSVMERVFAIALAHDQLAMQQGGGSSVDFADYLRALCANIDPARPGVAIEVKSEEAVLPLDRVVPAGLVVNELVTNSIKYAFGEAGGTIRVSFAVDAKIGEACLTVEDDGRGKPAGAKRGLGLSLVENFARQLGGRVEHADAAKGTRTILRFPFAF